MSIKGKVGGALTGLILSGGPFGAVAGALAGHWLYDTTAISRDVLFSRMTLEDTILGLSAGFLKINQSTGKKDVLSLFRVLDNILHMKKSHLKKNIRKILWFQRNLNTGDILLLLEKYKAFIDPEERSLIVQIIMILRQRLGFNSPDFELYTNKLQKWLFLSDSEMAFFKKKYDVKNLIYFDTLGISPLSNFREIQNHYLFLAKKYHPDKSESPPERNSGQSSQMKLVNEAWHQIKTLYHPGDF